MFQCTFKNSFPVHWSQFSQQRFRRKDKKSQISFLEQFQVTLSRLFGRDLKAPILSRTFQKKEEKNP